MALLDGAGYAADQPTSADGHHHRFEVRHHLDIENGFLTDSQVRDFVRDDTGADFYLCGPAPFMDLAERALLGRGVGPGQIFVERFDPATGGSAGTGQDGTGPDGTGPDGTGQDRRTALSAVAPL